MPKPAKPPRKTRQQLLTKVAELEAQLASTYHFASVQLDRAGSQVHQASAVIVRLTSLGGKEVTPPFAVLDGLSPATIDALRADILRSWHKATEFRPRGAPPVDKDWRAEQEDFIGKALDLGIDQITEADEPPPASTS